MENLRIRKKRISEYQQLLDRTCNDAPVELLRKEILLVLRTFLANIREDLTRPGVGIGRVAIPGFGIFTVRTRKERRILASGTKESMLLPAMRTIGFRPSKQLKKALGG